MKRKLKIEIGLAVLSLLIALFGSFLAPYDPLKVNYDFSLQPPSFLHIFGTDKLGRDVFSRILCGAKTSFGLTFLMLFLKRWRKSTKKKGKRKHISHFISPDSPCHIAYLYYYLELNLTKELIIVP